MIPQRTSPLPIGMSRRWLVTRALTVAGASLAPAARPGLSWGQELQGPGERPRGAPEPGFMAHAESLKRRAVDAGDHPYGAVVVRDGRVVGEGPSRVVVNRDPTAHAEMEAIRDAAQRLGTSDLSGCAMYATSRPCGMCEAAAYWARVSRVYFSAALTDGGAPRYPSC